MELDISTCFRNNFAVLVLAVIILGTKTAHATSAQTVLAQDGKALLKIVISEAASTRIRVAAMTLADYLGRISGTLFEVIAGDGIRGVAVGLASDFPGLSVGRDFKPDQIEQRERYVLRSHSDGIYIIGVSETAVENGIWDLLYRIGYRQFFPGVIWEFIPNIRKLTVEVDADERPDYLSRRIWYGRRTWDYNEMPYQQWAQRNRVRNEAFTVNSGHAYQAIIHTYQPEFDNHSEYLCTLQDGRKSSKFCIDNSNLRKLVVRYALDFFAKNPGADSVSVEPSDVGGWCECGDFSKSNSISDRVLFLANQVAEGLEKKYKDKYIAFYAYNFHSPPPAHVQAHPKVIVNFATALTLGGYTVDELIEGWRKMGVRQFGMREYYSVNTWDRDLPGSARGSDLDYLSQTIPHFHALGARFMSAESSDNWGPNGLGYYITSRLLWDVDEAKNVERIVNDFLDKAFGPARKPMTEFYDLVNGANKPLLSKDLVGRMYRLLDQASKMTEDLKIRARLDDLTLYTRYVELFRNYQNAKGEERQKAFEQLIRHTYRMRSTMMVHTRALYYDLPRRDKSVSIPQGTEWDVPEGKNPWKSSETFIAVELQEIRNKGIAGNQPIDWESVAFSDNLIPYTSSQSVLKSKSSVFHGRRTRQFYLWVDEVPANVNLKIKGGLIVHYRNRGNVRIDMYYVGKGQDQLVDANNEVPPDGQEHSIVLKTNHKGLHRLQVSDSGDMTDVEFQPGEKVVTEMSRKQPAQLSGKWTLYFYVPKGIKIVGGYRTGIGQIEDSNNHKIYQATQAAGADYFEVPVPDGQDGLVWRCANCTGDWRLMTVPPYLARSPQELLVPIEVMKSGYESTAY